MAEHEPLPEAERGARGRAPASRARAAGGGTQAPARLRPAQREAAAARRQRRRGRDPRRRRVPRLVGPRRARRAAPRRGRRRLGADRGRDGPAAGRRTPGPSARTSACAEPGLDRVIRSTYELLGLISFLTAGEDECRAWTIPRGTKAPAGRGRRPLRHRARLHPRAGGRLRGPRRRGLARGLPREGQPAPRGPRVRGEGRRRDRVQVQRLRPPCRPARPAGARSQSRARAASTAGRRCRPAVADEARVAAPSRGSASSSSRAAELERPPARSS